MKKVTNHEFIGAINSGNIKEIKRLMKLGRSMNDRIDYAKSYYWPGGPWGVVRSYQYPIHYAVHNNDFTMCQFLLEHGADVGALSSKGESALSLAIKGHATVVAKQINDGADIDAKNKNRFTALMLAAQNGHTDCIKALLEAGADKEAKAHKQTTALMLAAQNGHAECARALIDAGADKNAKTDKEVTALIFAAENGYIECVNALLKAQADKDTKADKKFTVPYACRTKWIYSMCQCLA